MYDFPVGRDHFVNVARRRAAEAAEGSLGGGFFADQFENPANFNTHYEASSRKRAELTTWLHRC